MKTKFSKRILSLFLAVMMVVTSIPMFALTASAAGTTLSAADQSLINSNEYLMTYFKDDTTVGQQVYMAVSNDGANWTPLNSNSPVLTAPTDEGAGAARDPYLYRGPDGTYYIIATSMDASLKSWWNYDGKGMYVWSSTDLINWSEPMFTNLSGEGLNGSKNNCWFGRIWAPQIVWDDSVDKYMIYLGLATEQDINGANPGLNTDMVRFYCTDPMNPSTYDWSDGSFEMMFETNPKADNISRTGKTGADSLHSRIDGDIYYDVATDKYYLYYSDYGDNGTMGTDYTKKTYYAVSDTLAGPYKGTVDPEYCLYDNSQMEGFTTYTLNDGTVMAFGDYNTGDSVSALFKMNSVTSISETTSNINNIDGAKNRARHGSVIDTNPATTNDLLNAISAYETKMENTVLKDKSTVYKNLQPAYNAYVAARKAYDAYYYGGNIGVDIDAYTKQLIAATNAMTAWTQYTANNPRPKFDQGTVPDSAFANLLYTRQANTYGAFSEEYIFQTWKTWGVTYNLNMEVQVGYNETVMMYDDSGIVPKAPVMFISKFHNTAGATRNAKVVAVYPTTGSGASADHGELFFDSKWRSAEGDDWNFENEYNNGTEGIGYNSSNQSEGPNMRALGSGNSSYKSSSNVIKYNLSTAWNTNEYYKTYKNLYWYVNSKNAGDGVTGAGTFAVNDNATIYVVNYKALTDAIKNCFAKLPANINSYKQGNQGGLSAILGAIDDATAYNPNSSFATASSASAGVTDFNNKLSSLVSALNSATLGSTDVDEDKYQSLRTAIDTAAVRDYSQYTKTSVDEYKTILSGARTLMAAVLEKGYNSADPANADSMVLNRIDALNPKLDKTEYNSQMTAKDKSLFTDSVQNYTFDSWKAVRDAINKLAPYKDRDGKYDKSTSPNLYYTPGNPITSLEYYPYLPSTDCTDDFNVLVNNLKALEFESCGDTQNFDAAKTVVSSIDRAMYTDSALSKFDKAVGNAVAGVYHTVTENEASTYGLTEGTNVILTSQSETDEFTKALLEAVNTLNSAENKDANVNKYSAKVYDEAGNLKETLNEYYGESFVYSLTDSIAEDDVVTWQVTVYANDTDMNKALDGDSSIQPINSQVVSTYNGNTIERTANGSMVITYLVDAGSKADTTTYKVYNAYGNVIDVVYSTELKDSSYFAENYPDPVLPFYKFVNWNVGKPNASGVVNVRPDFEAIPTKLINVDEANATVQYSRVIDGKPVVGSTVTITGNPAANIYGWAVEAGGKYQIVGYGKDYKFNVYADENYVPVLYVGGTYTVNDAPLTADKVAGFSNNSNGNLSDDAYLKAKLDSKAPFVYVYSFKVDNENRNYDTYFEKGTEKVKFYIRVTAGTEADNLAYGIVVDGKKIASTAKNEGGQFYMATTKEKYNGIASINAYTSYTFQYTFTDSNNVTTVATIATADYAEVK